MGDGHKAAKLGVPQTANPKRALRIAHSGDRSVILWVRLPDAETNRRRHAPDARGQIAFSIYITQHDGRRLPRRNISAEPRIPPRIRAKSRRDGRRGGIQAVEIAQSAPLTWLLLRLSPASAQDTHPYSSPPPWPHLPACLARQSPRLSPRLQGQGRSPNRRF